jgi:hypothetical protein
LLSLKQMSGECLKLDHGHFVPDPFQFITHLSPYDSTQYSLDQWYSTWGARTPGGTRRHLGGT